MKRILTSLIFVVLLFPSLALGEEIFHRDLVYRGGIHNGLYYKKFTDVPFTGKVKGEVRGTLKNGRPDGPWLEYHSNGQLFSKAIYKDGRMIK